MAYESTKSRTYSNAPAFGEYFDTEFLRLYVNTNGLKDGTFIDNNAIKEAHINAGAVTVNKLGNGAVTEGKLASDSVTVDKIKNGEITNEKLKDGEIDLTKFNLSTQAKFNGLKLLGELFSLDHHKSPSVDFPALCLSRPDGIIYGSGNPNGAGIIPGNFPSLFAHYYNKKLIYKPTTDNVSQFTITGWSYSGSNITVTFENITAITKILEALARDNVVHGSFSNWRTITLVEPLRNTSDAVQVDVGTYAITGLSASSRTINFTASGSPSGTAKTENRLSEFYTHRIAGSTTTVRHFTQAGRSEIAVEDTDGEVFGGLRRADQFQGHWHQTYNNGFGANNSATENSSKTSSTSWATPENDVLGKPSAREPISDGVNGTPRTGKTTHSPDTGVYRYIWAVEYSA